MDDKKAAEILLKLAERHQLEGEEKEAVLKAVGVLGWTSLGGSRIKTIARAQKAKLEKSIKD